MLRIDVNFFAITAAVGLAFAPHATADGPHDLLKVGRLHPPLALWTIQHDRPVSLASLRGQKVLLIHYASWNADSRDSVPGWFERLKPLIKDKKLVVLGVDHEQNADRGRLFAQWKGLPDPLLHDPLDLSGITRLPMVVAIDEESTIRVIQSNIDGIETSFARRPAPKTDSPKVEPEEAALPSPKLTRRRSSDARMASAYREHADACALAGTPKLLDEAVTNYSRAFEMDPKDAWSMFRLGVAYRIRYDRPERQPCDFQAAVDAWDRAVKLMPTSEIFLQRLVQYGPPAGRTNACFDWIPVARTEIRRRGVQPLDLEIEPLYTEISQASTTGSTRTHLPPQETIATDKNERVRIESTVVPSTDRKHAGTAEVHLSLRPSGAEWFNGKDPVRIWMERPKSARLDHLFFEIPNPKSNVSGEERTISFEVETKGKSREKTTLTGFAVYHLRIDGSKNRMLRQEFKITFGGKPDHRTVKKIDRAAPPPDKSKAEEDQM